MPIEGWVRFRWPFASPRNLFSFGLVELDMKKLLIACCAVLTVAVFFSDTALAQRGHAMGRAGGIGHVGGMGHVGGGMGRGAGMGVGGFAGHGVAVAPRSVGPVGRAAVVGHRAYYGGQRIVTPGGAAYRRGLPAVGYAPTHVRPGIAGAHYPRHRHRGRGFTYYYAGWWYAFPWWDSFYGSYYGDDCSYWDSQCAWQWGYGTRRYYRCMRYHGCY